MISQLFRNCIWYSRTFHNNLNYLEYLIRKNLHQKESFIIEEICQAWNRFKLVNLRPINISGINYDTWLEYQILKTHQNNIFIRSDDLTSEIKDYETEFGDLAILVDYYVEGEIISRKISIMQSKIDIDINKIVIPLHQLFLMHYWPTVSYSGKQFVFDDIYPDVFSFYHFILRYSHNNNTSSTTCSTPYVSYNLNLNKASFISILSGWLTQRKVNPKKGAPTRTLNMILNPVITSRQVWQSTSKPFTRMLKECAYQFWGTSDKRLLQLAKERIKNIIRLKVVAAKNQNDWIEKRSNDFMVEF